MSQSHSQRGEISFGPCPPNEFAGRVDERKTLMEVLQGAKDHGQVVMISGRRGSGKSSFLNWAENKIQNETDDLIAQLSKKNSMRQQEWFSSPIGSCSQT